MSIIYFHSQSEDAKVRGSERFHAGSICGDLLIVSLGLAGASFDNESAAKLLKVVPPKHYLQRMEGFQLFNSLKTYLSVAHDNLVIAGEEIPIFRISLNSAFSLGSDPVKLLARLHGQCELHCYIEEPNRGWVAEIIQEGLSMSLYRREMGWDKVIELLKDPEVPGPVICSYSVCEQFPNAHLAHEADLWHPAIEVSEDGNTEQNWDSWYELPDSERWDLAMQALRQLNEDRMLEINPETWKEFQFGNGQTGFDVLAYCEHA